ncbi:sigma factor-like helix-turn-helix DNA-binding protein [Nocardia sp. NPDC050712]|uniref:sigma factor-like helix-turn-helix DNA-binding protein n=1 Tax=Nocardia sp. NPDC050712 TaxID=3155518 RepID=UPI0033CAB3E6
MFFWNCFRPDRPASAVDRRCPEALGEVAPSARNGRRTDLVLRPFVVGVAGHIGETLPAEEKGYTLIDDALSAAPLLSALAEREIAVLAMRYGQDKTQPELVAALGVSQIQVSRILSRALQQLRTRKNLGRVDPGRQPALGERALRP